MAERRSMSSALSPEKVAFLKGEPPESRPSAPEQSTPQRSSPQRRALWRRSKGHLPPSARARARHSHRPT